MIKICTFYHNITPIDNQNQHIYNKIGSEIMNKEFETYIKNYDLNNQEIYKKYLHSYRVMNLSKKYATLLNWKKHDIELATIIGLLHDIGRFEQLKTYNTYNDKNSIDHASYGVKILFKNELIKKFWKDEKDYEIIKFAINNHNKYEIEKKADKQALMHAKLIRDTDKLDIIYHMGFLKTASSYATNNPISKEVLNCIKNKTQILNQYKNNNNDKIISILAFTYNIYNNICLKELKRNLEEYYKYVDPNKYLINIYQKVINDIDNKLKSEEI